MYIKAYIFQTEIEAQEAQNTINQHYGFPINKNSETINYVDYEQYNDVFFIRYIDEIKEILGEPLKIKIENE